MTVVAGLAIACFGAAVDFILPSASPGLNLAQTSVIAAGLMLAGVGWRSRKMEARRKLLGAKGKSLAIALLLAALTLAILEAVLLAGGMSTLYPRHLPELRVTPGDWTVCDAPGCRYDYERARVACEKNQLTGRACALNRQGYADSDEFIAPAAYGDELRLLALGDSFTFGSSAEIGKSYVDALEARFPGAAIWNTGISASGTTQAIRVFVQFAPRLRPQVTTLGFYMNDFDDNLLPVEGWQRVVTPSGNHASMRRHFFDAWGNVYSVEAERALHYYGYERGPPRNGLEQALGATRLGTLTLRLRDSLALLTGQLRAKKLAATRAALATLRDLTLDHDSAILALVIPRRTDVAAPGEWYLAALELLEDLGIAHLDLRPVLDPLADYAEPPDGHWNTAGHQKVGALLGACIEVFRQTGGFAGCEGIAAAKA